MKIALCISGQPRIPEKTFGSIKNNVIDPNNITDVFVHSWWNKEWKDEQWVDRHGKNKISLLKKNSFDFIREHYKPLKMEVEHNDCSRYLNREYFEKLDCTIKGDVLHVQSMYHSIQKVNELKNLYKRENKIDKYDWVIRMRFDYVFNKPIIINNLDPNNIHVPGGIEWKDITDLPCANDQFAIGREYIMDIYAATFESIESQCRIDKLFLAEKFIGTQMKNFNITINMPFNYTQDLNILR
jgi:hypothetical protein